MKFNVYQMIAAGSFDTPGGLWIRRDSWADCIARVTEFETLEGVPPYYRNQLVWVDLFYPRGVRFKVGEELSCPGTYAYTQIEAPKWWTDGRGADCLQAVDSTRGRKEAKRDPQGVPAARQD